MTESTEPQHRVDVAETGDIDASGVNGVGTPTTSLEEQLQAARAEADEMRDKYLRAHADMDNFRKRMERNYAEQSRSQTKALLTRLLGVKDNLERALQYGNGNQSGEGIIEGVRLTLYQLDSLLEQEGVKGIEAEGRPFDPHLDEAVHSVHDPGVADHTVVQVVRKGYTLNDEVLRPAQVVVSVHE
jgi:molecular chaperone GrpE